MNNLELTDINKYRLNEINKIKDYFNIEMNDRKNIIKKLSIRSVLIILIKYLLLCQHHLVR